MSDKKQFENIENKIKQAVENGPADYGQPAWEKMEALLDKKERKRRPFLWWFILPLLLAGTWGIYKLTESPASLKTANTNSPAHVTTTQQETGTDRSKAIQPPTNGITSGEESKAGISVGMNKTAEINATKKISSRPHKRAGGVHPNTKQPASPGAAEDDFISIADKDNKLADSEKINSSQTGAEKKEATVSSMEKTEKDSSSKQVLPQNEIVKADQKNDKKAPQKNKAATTKGFYFLGSVGVDIASVEPFSYNNSDASAKYGIGLGYQLNNKWSVQTGFYASNKKYVAGPDDYHPKGYYWNSPAIEIKAVDAKCLVYEIPVTVKYNFIVKQSVLYYLSASASSYIMKEEDYNFHYDSSGIYHQKYTEYTGNKHLFSTLTFAVGFEKKLSPVFSILAEPSFSIPLSGVGYGNVKIYSTALQVGIKYKPLKKH